MWLKRIVLFIAVLTGLLVPVNVYIALSQHTYYSWILAGVLLGISIWYFYMYGVIKGLEKACG